MHAVGMVRIQGQPLAKIIWKNSMKPVLIYRPLETNQIIGCELGQ